MTTNKEDYIKEIYHLGGARRNISNKELAQRLHVSQASVSEMLVKLRREGYILYEPYAGSSLTPAGIAAAAPLLRAHQLLEVFLREYLHYRWSEIHEDAELLEHATSPRLEKRLAAFLNHPQCCPHGTPIPDENGVLHGTAIRPLSSVEPGETVVLRQVRKDAQLLDYLETLGLKVGAELTVEALGAYEGPLRLTVDGRQLELSYKAASQVFVDAKPDSPDEPFSPDGLLP